MDTIIVCCLIGIVIFLNIISNQLDRIIINTQSQRYKS